MPRASEAQPPSTKPPSRGPVAAGLQDGGSGQGAGPPGPGNAVLHLSCLLGSAVSGPSNQQEGRLVDVIARLSGANSAGWHPAVTGLVVDFEGQERFAHAHQLVSLSYESAVLSVEPAALGPFERRPGEVLLKR
ncbi:MAG: hypothetical protein ABSE77_19700, partial [Acidimicrobiales bacterium]